VKLNAHLCLVSMFRIRGAIPPLPIFMELCYIIQIKLNIVFVILVSKCVTLSNTSISHPCLTFIITLTFLWPSILESYIRILLGVP
jgi:hypothetical protein